MFHTTTVSNASSAEPESAPGPCADVVVTASMRPALLIRGTMHPAVRDAQRRINAFHVAEIAAGRVGISDAPLVADCIFGQATERAILSFQQRVFPGVLRDHDGKLGPKTWAQFDRVAVHPPAPPTPSIPPPAPPTPSAPSRAIDIPVPTACVQVPVLDDAAESRLSRDPSDFGGIAAIREFAERLAGCTADRIRQRTGSEPSKRALALTAVGALEQDFAATIHASAGRARSQGSTARLAVSARGWMVGRREEVDFETLGAGGRYLSIESFLPPASIDRLEPLERAGRNVPPVQPLANRLMRELWSRSPATSASNYPGHGGGKFKNRGFSLDLTIGGPLDDRGFYARDRAVAMLLALDAAAASVGATWRVLYNDYAVAAAVNRRTGLRHVVFVGQTRPDGTNLNWHGPLVLHFHLDIAPSLREQGGDGTVPWSDERVSALPSSSITGGTDETRAGIPFGEQSMFGEWRPADGWARSDESLEESGGLDKVAAIGEEEWETLSPAEEDREHFTPWNRTNEVTDGSEMLEQLLAAETGTTELPSRLIGVATLAMGPPLRRGSRGPAVAALQRVLTSLGHPLAADGDFGSRTEHAVKSFQASNLLIPDGVVGQHTKMALAAAIGRGNTPLPPRAYPPAAPPGASSPTPSQGQDWSQLPVEQRARYVLGLLVTRYGYPVNGAAGLVGNLWAESGIIPSRLEGSRPETPLRTRDVSGTVVDFTPEDVMLREPQRRGPALPGVGLAQWTSRDRRAGLFQHSYQGIVLGGAILFDMDAQVNYLVAELRGSYAGVDAILRTINVSLDEACDEVVYSFERPGSIIAPDRKSRLARTHPAVQAVFAERRRLAQRALQAHRAAG